ncbi:MAG: hypothetical protein QOH60_830 [Mycobacterium sp.]|jgi:hypothetical protein|nr:hypothetical protein [Mycobacterium sp.]
MERVSVLFIVLVGVVVAIHFAFIGYLVVGGFLAVRWPRTFWLHLAAVAWGVGRLALHLLCPLTEIELWARPCARMAPLTSTGFIDHYIAGVLFPPDDKGLVVVVFTTALVSWALLAVVSVNRRSSLRP